MLHITDDSRYITDNKFLFKTNHSAHFMETAFSDEQLVYTIGKVKL